MNIRTLVRAAVAACLLSLSGCYGGYATSSYPGYGGGYGGYGGGYGSYASPVVSAPYVVPGPVIMPYAGRGAGPAFRGGYGGYRGGEGNRGGERGGERNGYRRHEEHER
ncbi:MAG: hypothetical protein PHW13_10915 [Methylococcales bacterium]|nr:hypothetical protein [Methylococcales bacterium]